MYCTRAPKQYHEVESTKKEYPIKTPTIDVHFGFCRFLMNNKKESITARMTV